VTAALGLDDTMAANGVDFVAEIMRERMFLPLFEKIANTPRLNAYGTSQRSPNR